MQADVAVIATKSEETMLYHEDISIQGAASVRKQYSNFPWKGRHRSKCD